MKLLYYISFYSVFFLTNSVNCQVGIGTENPLTTLDIRNTNQSNFKDGILFPKISKSFLANKYSNVYGTNQIGSIIYVNDISMPTTGSSIAQVENIQQIGYHYLGDDLKWHHFVLGDDLYNLKNIYIADDVVINERKISQNTQKLFFNRNPSELNNDPSFLIGKELGETTIAITNNGLGIGVNSPSADLHISSLSSSTDPLFKLQDGTEYLGKFLTSDINGNASWYTGIETAISLGHVPISGSDTISGDTSTFSTILVTTKAKRYPQTYIYLTKGKWLVSLGATFGVSNSTSDGTNPQNLISETNNAYLSLSLSDTNSDTYEDGSDLPTNGFKFLGNKYISSFIPVGTTGQMTYWFISGVIPIEVTDTKVLLFEWVAKIDRSIDYSIPSISMNNYGENYIYAVPLN